MKNNELPLLSDNRKAMTYTSRTPTQVLKCRTPGPIESRKLSPLKYHFTQSIVKLTPHQSNENTLKSSKLPFTLLKTSRNKWKCPANPNIEALKSVMRNSDKIDLKTVAIADEELPDTKKSDIERLLESQSFTRKVNLKLDIEDLPAVTDSSPVGEMNEMKEERKTERKIKNTSKKIVYSTKMLNMKKIFEKMPGAHNLLKQLDNYEYAFKERSLTCKRSLKLRDEGTYCQMTFGALKNTSSFAGKIMNQIRRQTKKKHLCKDFISN